MKTRFVLLLVVLAAQLLWLSSQYIARCHELETSPCLKLRVSFYDPVDFFRGHYQRVDFSQELPLDSPLIGSDFYVAPTVTATCESPLPRAKALSPDAVPVSRYGKEDAILIWQRGEDGLASLVRVDAGNRRKSENLGEGMFCTQGTIKILSRPSTSADGDGAYLFRSKRVDGEPHWERLTFRVAFRHPLEFFVSESDGDLRETWKKTWGSEAEFPRKVVSELPLTAEVIVRPNGSLMPKQLYVEGIPWSEYLQLIRDKKVLQPSQNAGTGTSVTDKGVKSAVLPVEPPQGQG